MTLEEIRAKYPQYNDLPDAAFVDGFYKKFYSDMPREQFDAKLGLNKPTPPGMVMDFDRKPPNENWPLGNLITDPNTQYQPVEAAAQLLAGGLKSLGMDDTGAAKAGRDLHALPNSLGALGHEFTPLDSAPRPAKPVTAPAKAPVMPAAEWQKAKNIAYKEVDDAGAKYSQGGFGRMVDNIELSARAGKINPLRHPKATSMIEELKAAKGSTPTLTELDQWRQIVRRDVKGDEAEQFFGEKIEDAIDDFIDNATGKDMVAGDPRQAAELILKARKTNSIYRKTEVVEDALAKAERAAAKAGSGGNVDNTIRQAADSILKNRKAIRFFTKEEKDALDHVVRGGSLQNFARLVGKLSPEGNGLMLFLQLMSGSLSGGMTLPLAVGGYAAKRFADTATRANLDDVTRLIQGQ
jgi:hypothetical protein